MKSRNLTEICEKELLSENLFAYMYKIGRTVAVICVFLTDVTDSRGIQISCCLVQAPGADSAPPGLW